ncbi:hypothetical protein [Nostoc sp. 2RC]|nr:hypothetical protein [Nostoc sp. 2RC]MBC1236220.1 hypothetical protein [Nostoc sp. 2RC]
MGHWALVLSEVVGAASRREVLGVGHWALCSQQSTLNSQHSTLTPT